MMYRECTRVNKNWTIPLWDDWWCKRRPASVRSSRFTD